MSRHLIRLAFYFSHPSRRMVLRLVLLALALLAGWLFPHHVAFAEDHLLPAGHGT